jgi:hypothetical protein
MRFILNGNRSNLKTDLQYLALAQLEVHQKC